MPKMTQGRVIALGIVAAVVVVALLVSPETVNHLIDALLSAS